MIEYPEYTWHDKNDGSGIKTPINADNLNRIEGGVSDCAEAINETLGSLEPKTYGSVELGSFMTLRRVTGTMVTCLCHSNNAVPCPAGNVQLGEVPLGYRPVALVQTSAGCGNGFPVRVSIQSTPPYTASLYNYNTATNNLTDQFLYLTADPMPEQTS